MDGVPKQGIYSTIFFVSNPQWLTMTPIINKRRSQINAAADQKNAAFTRGELLGTTW